MEQGVCAQSGGLRGGWRGGWRGGGGCPEISANSRLAATDITLIWSAGPNL